MKRNIILLLPYPVLLIAFLLYRQKDLIIYPAPASVIELYSDSDTNPEGKSSKPVSYFSDSAMSVRFTLHDGYGFPYAGIQFFLDSLHNKTVLSGYDCIKLKIRAVYSRSLKFVLHLDYSNKDFPARVYPHRVLEQEVSLEGEYYELSLKDFITPSWWYRKNQITEKEAGPPDFSGIRKFLIQTGVHTPIGKKEIFTVKTVKLSQDTTLFWLCSLGFIAAYYLLFFLINRRKKEDKHQTISYKKLDIPKNPEEEKLFRYLSSNYHDTSLSIEKINRELGIPVTKIPVLIKNRTGISFKQYINTIRIQEAKRLLGETDEQITQISYAVGYNTVTHFNKVFRQMENISPKEYRGRERSPKEIQK